MFPGVVSGIAVCVLLKKKERKERLETPGGFQHNASAAKKGTLFVT